MPWEAELVQPKFGPKRAGIRALRQNTSCLGKLAHVGNPTRMNHEVAENALLDYSPPTEQIEGRPGINARPPLIPSTVAAWKFVRTA